MPTDNCSGRIYFGRVGVDSVPALLGNHNDCHYIALRDIGLGVAT